MQSALLHIVRILAVKFVNSLDGRARAIIKSCLLNAIYIRERQDLQLMFKQNIGVIMSSSLLKSLAIGMMDLLGVDKSANLV